MATNYPGGTDAFTNPIGTQTLDSPDHASQHGNANDAISGIQSNMGTNSGTNIHKFFVAGNFPVRMTGVAATGTSLQTLIGGTYNNTVIGTSAITGGTYNAGVFGSPAITNGTMNNAVFGTPAITGGTGNAMVLGTPKITLVGSTASSDTRIDADTAGTKVLTFTSVRQGGTATDWGTAGTANFPVANIFIQAGALSLPDSSSHAVVFPQAFSKSPVVTTGVHNYANAGVQAAYIIANSATGFTAVAGATANGSTLLHWIAIGER